MTGEAHVRGDLARMFQPRPPQRLLLGLLIAVGVAGCGQDFDGQEPPAPPTKAELSRFIAETRQPAYWLGARFRGLAVSHTSAHDWGVALTYGPWTCDSGCTDEGGVMTGRRSVADDLSRADVGYPVDPKQCWTRVGKAVAAWIGCDQAGFPQELVILAAEQEILVTSLSTADGESELSVRTVVRGLRPLNDLASWPLPRPRPLSCREFDRVDRRYRRHMPQPLRPRAKC